MSFFTEEELSYLSNCQLCPRKCKVDRFSTKLGYCNSNANFQVASICIHKGEEPVLSGSKGICNVFFPHCNLQCIYCQNHNISENNNLVYTNNFEFDEIISRICYILESSENIVGFVSPSHYIPQMLAIIRGLHKIGRNPVIVYNTNAYDNVETLRMLEGIVDVYLPDFKYIDPELAFRYSKALNYPQVARLALKEMYRQKGATLIMNDCGLAESGIIVRHLVLPDAANQSIDILKYLSDEISPKLYVSLMAQYFPTTKIKNHPNLNRTITAKEYTMVVNAFHKFGFYRGWVQNLSSQAVFRPDFSNQTPFEL